LNVTGEEADVNALKLMAVFAHPDDEAFGMGGTLSKYAAAGYDVFLVTATRGEAGEIAEPARGVASKANLPDVREQELRCACQTYGIHPPHFLDYLDGQLTIVHQGQAVGKLVRILREIRPQVVVSYGPDGIYGHYDHIAVHRWTTIALKLAADRSCFPDIVSDTCQTHAVSKLYYNVLPQEQADEWTKKDPLAGVMMDGVPFPFVGWKREDITTVIDVSAYARLKLTGLLCHQTQISRAGPFGQDPEDVLRAPYFQKEHFVLAHSTVGWPSDVENDLFGGVK
jgi:LmbE family N-acetylglucosaminyl deacetylase